MSKVIYFIAAADQMERSLVKIGITGGDPTDRLKALQTGSPVKLMLLATVVGDQSLERALHNTFEPVWERGEWFRLSGRLFSLVVALHYYSRIGENVASLEQFMEACSVFVIPDEPVVIAEGENEEDWLRSANMDALVSWFSAI